MVHIINPRSFLVSRLKGVHVFGFDGAPCSQRVCFALAEKGLLCHRSVPWKSAVPTDCEAIPGAYTFRQVSLIRKEHLDPDYAAIQPNLVVPALLHHGRLHIESMDIIAYLDETRPANPLAPASASERQLCEDLVELGKALHVSVRYVSFHWGLRGLGKLNDKEEQQLRQLEQAGSPENLVDFYSRFDRNAIDATTFVGHLRALESGWEEQEARLASDGRPYLTGRQFSKADIIWAIKTQRIFECGYPLKQNFPNLHAWFTQARKRRGFQGGVVRNNWLMSNAFRLKAAFENLTGTGIARSSAAASSASV